MSTWAGVVRVSDMGGRDEESDRFRSARDQEEAMRGALPPGDDLDLLPAELDVSGGVVLDKRPSLLAAVEGVEAGKYAGVVVAYQSRLGRDVEVEESVWRRVEAAGGRIILALDGLDTTTSDGRMVRRIRSAINHAERERHVDQFDRLRKHLTLEGVWQGRIVPFGYDKDPTTRRLIPNADAPRVEAAFVARANGVSVARIALDLGMSPSGVSGLLQNRLYLGELTVGKYHNPAAHPAIVPPDVWQRAQRAKTITTRKAGPALLTGLVVCCGCGSVMARAGSPRSYACRRVTARGECVAPAAVSADKLDKLVDEIAHAALERIKGGPQQSDAALKRAQVAHDAAVAERDAFLTGVRAASIPANAYAETLRERQAAVDAADAELSLALENAGDAREWVGQALDLWDEMTVEHRNRALRRLIECVLVERAGGPGGGKGRQRPLADRVRVVERGHGLVTLGAGPIVLPDREAPFVLRV